MQHANFYAFSCDCKRAYDSVETYVGKEIALRRTGVPELIIQMITDMDINNSAVVLTAFGMTDDILDKDEGTFCYERGWTQGASESPAGWISTYDILLSLLDDNVDTTDLGTNLTSTKPDKRHALAITAIAYVDDALLLGGSRQGIEFRANLASLYFEFIGIQFNPDKSEVVGMEWINGKHIDLATQSWNPIIYDSNLLFKHGDISISPQLNGHIQPESVTNMCSDHQRVKTVPVDTGIKYLGNRWSPKLDLTDVTDSLTTEIARDAISMKGYDLKPESVMYLTSAVSKVRFLYRTLSTNLTQRQCETIEQKVKKPFLKSLKMCNANTNLLHTPRNFTTIGWHPWYTSLMLKRLELIAQNIQNDDALGKLLQNSVKRFLRTNYTKKTTTSPTPNTANENNTARHTKSHTHLIHTTLAWANKHGLTLNCKTFLNEHNPADTKLVDMAQTEEDLDILQKGCQHYNKYWLSQILTGNTILMPDKGPTKNKFHEKVNELIGPYMEPNNTSLPGTEVLIGSVVESDTVLRTVLTNEGTKLTTMAIITAMNDNICYGYDLVQSTSSPTLNNDTVYIPKQDGTPGGQPVQLISRLGSTLQIKLPGSPNIIHTINSNKLLERTPIQSNYESNMMTQFYRRDPWYRANITQRHLIRHHELKQWNKNTCIRIPSKSKITKNLESYTISYSHRVITKLINHTPKHTKQHQELPSKFGNLCEINQELLEHTWSQNEKSVFDFEVGSDGSVKGDRGTFAWIASSKTGSYAGGGEITSPNCPMHPFRAESAGILSAMTHLWDESYPNRTVKLTTDCETAEEIFNGKYSTNKSVDIWEEILWWKKKWGSNFVVVWKRGHPEKREKDTTKWTDDDWRNHGADKICDLMYYTGKVIQPSDYQHGQKWNWKLHEQRIPNNDFKTLENIISEEALSQLCNTSNIQKNIIDWTHTGKVLNTKHKPLLTRKSTLNRIFDRGYLHANMLARGLYGEVPDFVRNNKRSENSRIWIHNNKNHTAKCATTHSRKHKNTFWRFATIQKQ